MAKLKFRPLHDRVVVKRIDAEEKSTGGIIIPDTAKEKPSQGEIVAVGPGGRDESGKLVPIEREGRRPRAVRQVVGHRSEARWRGSPDHEGIRHHGRDRLKSSNPKFFRSELKWLPKTYVSPATRATACCAASRRSPTP